MTIGFIDIRNVTYLASILVENACWELALAKKVATTISPIIEADASAWSRETKYLP
jgi:hypothetical protein